MPQQALAISHLSKRFAAIQALDDVCLSVAPGEVRALVGENGAGKSTLVKILAGYHTPDEGELRLWEEPVALPVSRPAGHGIAIVHQDLGLAEGLSVWENIGVGAGYERGLVQPLSRRKEATVARDLIARFGQDFGPYDDVSTLRQSERSIVAVLRAIREMESHRRSEKVLVLDEPTSSLFGEEVERLLAFVRQVADEGAAVILIEHHLQHVLDAADTVTVLRSGRVVGTHPVASLSVPQLVQLMLGYDFDALEHASPSLGARRHVAEGPALRVEALFGSVVRDLSFEVEAGEVVGLTGLSGMGHEEAPYLIAGAVPRRGGTITVADEPVGNGLGAAVRRGLVLIPDRRQGVWLDGTANENVTLPVLYDLAGKWRMARRKQIRRTRELMEEFDVQPRDPTLPMSSFSGGNQQKLLLAKWLQVQPKVVVLDSPTRGVDAGGRLAVLRLLRAAAGEGCAAVVCSEDAEELTEVCDRILVLRDGTAVASVGREEMSVPRVLHLRETRGNGD